MGRRAELADIDRSSRGTGEPPVLLFAGEPGIGKTRLLDEAAARATESGWRVVRGDCQPWEQDPYSPLTDALARSIHALPERERAAALADTPSLGLLLPDLVEVSPAGSPWRDRSGDRVAGLPGPEGERRMLFSAVSRYFRRVAGRAGTLLVLDDLQWAGDDALRLLATLVTSSEQPPIRLIGAYRDSEVAADDTAPPARGGSGSHLPYPRGVPRPPLRLRVRAVVERSRGGRRRGGAARSFRPSRAGPAAFPSSW